MDQIKFPKKGVVTIGYTTHTEDIVDEFVETLCEGVTIYDLDLDKHQLYSLDDFKHANWRNKNYIKNISLVDADPDRKQQLINIVKELSMKPCLFILSNHLYTSIETNTGNGYNLSGGNGLMYSSGLVIYLYDKENAKIIKNRYGNHFKFNPTDIIISYKREKIIDELLKR